MKEAEKEAGRWAAQAEDDLLFVKWVLKEGIFFDKGCFISQQAGEKILKACLYATGKRIVLGHSLFEMTKELIALDPAFEAITSEVKRLDRFYIPTRYPNGLPGGSPFKVFTREDLEMATTDLARIFDLCRSFLTQSTQATPQPK